MIVSDWSVNVYLVVFMVLAGVSILIGLFASVMGRQHPLDNPRLLRGIWELSVTSGFLVLFRSKIIENGFVVLLAVGVFSLAGYFVVRLIAKSRGILIEAVQTEECKRENWERLRAKGKLRYVLRSVLLFSYLGLSWAVFLSILLSNQLIFIPIAFFLSFAILGCVDGIVDWKRNEEKYMPNASSTLLSLPKTSAKR